MRPQNIGRKSVHIALFYLLLVAEQAPTLLSFLTTIRKCAHNVILSSFRLLHPRLFSGVLTFNSLRDDILCYGSQL